MIIKKIILPAAIILLLGVFFGKFRHNEMIQYSSYREYTDVTAFYEESFFNSRNNIGTTEHFSDVKAMILPHHLVASNIIHKAFMSVKDNSYDTVIIVGPDHKSLHDKTIFFSDSGWFTPFGPLESNKKICGELYTYQNIKADNTIIQTEHSSTSLLPYVKYYFPEASVVCIAVPAYTNMYESRKLGKHLGNICSENTLVIASVDFSHYLLPHEARIKDKETKKVLLERDTDKLFTFGNDNLDSPQSITILLSYMESNSGFAEIILDNINSYDILHIPNEGTTSYFTVLYQKK